MKRLWLLLLLAWWGVSQAQVGAWTWDLVIPSGASTLEYVSGGAVVSNGPGTGSMFLGRTFGAASVNGSPGASIAETLRLPLGGNSIDVVATRAVAWDAVAAGAVAVGAAAYVGVQVGAPIAKAMGYSQVDIGPVRCVATFTGWQCDDGAPPSDQDGIVFCFESCPSDGSGGDTSAVGAFNAVSVAARNDRTVGNPNTGDHRVAVATSMVPYAFPPSPTNAGSVQVNVTYSGDGFSVNTTASLYWIRIKVHTCPAVIDALNPAYSSASPPVGPDGKCPTGRYSGASNAKVADRLTQYGDKTVAPELAQDVLRNGGTLNGAQPGASPSATTGPASITGQPTVTQKPNGDGTSTRTTTTPTTNYTYNNQTITYNITNNTKTEVLNQAGDVISTSNSSSSSTPEQSDQCKSNPDSAGCAKLGDPPTDSPQWETRNVDFAVDDLGLPSGCPVSRTWTFHGWTLLLNYQPACDVAPTVRLALVACSALGAALYIVMTVVKG